jgi:hypothetical protein
VAAEPSGRIAAERWLVPLNRRARIPPLSQRSAPACRLAPRRRSRHRQQLSTAEIGNGLPLSPPTLRRGDTGARELFFDRLRHEVHHGRLRGHAMQLQFSMQRLRNPRRKLHPHHCVASRHTAPSRFTPKQFHINVKLPTDGAQTIDHERKERRRFAAGICDQVRARIGAGSLARIIHELLAPRWEIIWLKGFRLVGQGPTRQTVDVAIAPRMASWPCLPRVSSGVSPNFMNSSG